MAWDGEEELTKSLAALASAKGTSASRVKNTSNIALKHVKEYKRVVHAVEHFLWKAEPEHRLAGLFTIDSIIRQSRSKNGSKDVFTKRFGLHLSQTMGAVKRVPEDDQSAAKRVINEWLQRNVYTREELVRAAGEEYLAQARLATSLDGGALPGAGSSQIADILSLLKKQQSGQTATSNPLLPVNSGSRSETPGIGLGLSSSELRGARMDIDNVNNSQTTNTRPSSPMKQPRSRINTRWGPMSTNENTPHTTDFRLGQQIPPPGKYGEGERGNNARGDSDYRSQRNGGYSFDERSRAQRSNRDSNDHIHPNVQVPGDYRNRRDVAPENSPYQQSSGDYREDTRSREAPGPQGRGVVICRQFERNNTCQFGDTCRYSHGNANSGTSRGYNEQGGHMNSSNDMQNLRSPQNRQPSGNGAFYAPSQGQGGSPHNDRRQTGRGENNVSPRGARGEREVCRQYQLGRCRFGDSCRRIHSGSERDAAFAPGPQSQPPFVPSVDLRKTKLCSNFPKGKCRFGDSCMFAHSEAEIKPRAAVLGMAHAPPVNRTSPRKLHQSSPGLAMNHPHMAANPNTNLDYNMNYGATSQSGFQNKHPNQGDTPAPMGNPDTYPINNNKSNMFVVKNSHETISVHPVPPNNEVLKTHDTMNEQIHNNKRDEEEEEEESAQPQFMLEYDDEDGDDDRVHNDDPTPRKRSKTS